MYVVANESLPGYEDIVGNVADAEEVDQLENTFGHRGDLPNFRHLFGTLLK
jgi:hypothetical protein